MPAHKRDEFLARIEDSLLYPGIDVERMKSELADHVATRVDELQAEGYSADEAWERAETELGDLNELVELEQQVDWQTKRRNWMRFTTLSIIGGFVATVMIMSSWPENSRLAMIPSVAGQDEDGAVQGAASEQTNNQETEAKLAQRMDADFLDSTLDDLLDFLGQELDVNIYVDQRGLEEYGLDTTESVTLTLRNVRASMVLELALRQHELAYTIRDGIVFITTPEQVETNLTVKVYNCRELLQKMAWSYFPGGIGPGDPQADPFQGPGGLGAGPQEGPTTDHPFGTSEGGADNSGNDPFGQSEPPASSPAPLQLPSRWILAQMGFGGGGMGGMGGGPGGGGMHPAHESRRPEDRDLYELIRIITQTVAPESWHELGGPASISGMNGLLVVRQSYDVHEKIEDLLEQLEAAIASGPQMGGFF